MSTPPRHADSANPGDDPDTDPETAPAPGHLVPRRVPNGDRVTTVRLEAGIWEALDEIATREGLMVNEVCQRAAAEAGGRHLAAALRVYALRYFREAARHADPADPPIGNTPDG